MFGFELWLVGRRHPCNYAAECDAGRFVDVYDEDKGDESEEPQQKSGHGDIATGIYCWCLGFLFLQPCQPK